LRQTVDGYSYGIIVKVTSDNASKLKDTISRKIKRIEKVKSTQTMTIIEGQY
jgi:DNA-binding Lrp family transcriptional regulator